jgi:hypothetical protein
VKIAFLKEKTTLDINANISASSKDFQKITCVDDFE